MAPTDHCADPDSHSDRDGRVRHIFDALSDDPLRRAEQYDEVVLMHLDIAESIARRYRNRGVSHDDLVQVACLGLIKAAHGFDPQRGSNFMGYAVPTMLGEVKRFFRDHAWLVRPPRRVQELQAQISTSAADLQQQMGRVPTRREVAASTGAAPRDVDEALLADHCYTPSSLDRPMTEGGAALSEMLGRSESGYSRAEAISTLRPLCERLDERDRTILFLRFFGEWTQARIATELQITQMQVSRILRRILDDLRDQMLAEDEWLTPAS